MDSLTKFFHKMACVLARRPIKEKASVPLYQNSWVWALVFGELFCPMDIGVVRDVLRKSLSNVVGGDFGFEKDIIHRLARRLLTARG